MRADEMARLEAAGEQNMADGRTGAGGSRAGPLADVTGVLRTGEPKGFEERKILEIRSKTASLLKEVREADQRLNQHIGRRSLICI